MTGPRRTLPWLVATVLVLSPAPALAQGGAGDDQYQDPFANGTSGSTNSGSSGSGSSGGNSSGSTSSGSGSSGSGSAGATGPRITNRPPGTPGVGASGSGSGSTTATAPSGSSAAGGSPSASASAAGRRQLPNTGLDAPALALLGAGLLVTGVGLRLRTVDETVF